MENKSTYWASVWKEYEENECNNCHTENIVLMTKSLCLNQEDIEESEKILKEHYRAGFLTSDLGRRRDKLGNKYYPIFRKTIDRYLHRSQ